MPNLREQRRAIQKELRGFIGQNVIALGTNVTRNLFRTTPVDTGYARANWIPAIGRPRTEPVGVPPRRAGIGRSVRQVTAQAFVGAALTGAGVPGPSAASAVNAAEAVQQEGLATLRSYRLESGSVFVSNNVRYITRLNMGHSQQAPSGYVQRTIAQTVQQTSVQQARR